MKFSIISKLIDWFKKIVFKEEIARLNNERVKLTKLAEGLNKRDDELKEKENELTRLRKELELKKMAIEKRRVEIETERQRLNKREEELRNQEGELEKRQKKLNKKKEALDRREAELKKLFKKILQKKEKEKRKPTIKKPPTEVVESDEKPSGEEQGSPSPKPEESARVVAPFVEVALDEAKVYLVIPKQSFRPTTESIPQKRLDYKVKLNDGKEKSVQADIIKREEYWELAEKRIELEKPIQNFEVNFPPELKNKAYRYGHQNNFIYIFLAVGNNYGKMHRLYNTNGNINPLPQKEIWVLLKEDFELGIEPDVIEDIWVWENYRALCVNLKNVSELVVKNRNTNEKEVIPCESAFSIDGEEVVYDDFREQSPIFTGDSIEIKAPRVNEEGWRVWVQNKQSSYKIVSDNWSGKEPLKLKLDNVLPCECGEFQVDICEQKGESVTTLFFRYIPSLQLNYPKELIIPDSEEGHKIEKIEVLLQEPKIWELETTEQRELFQGGYKIGLPPEKDTLLFSICKKEKPETKTNFSVTIPRLKWKTSGQKDWIDKPIDLKRQDLIAGEDFEISINTNSFTRYDILATLEAMGQTLQESKFIRKGKTYNLFLNQFYDTIKKNRDELVLDIEIPSSNQCIKIINFLPPELICKFCNFNSYHKEKMLNHIKEKHLSEFFDSLSLEELRMYDSSLPHSIYKCPYCGYYVREDDPAYPTSAICNHIERKCPNVDRSKGVKVKFPIVKNTDEIRENVLPNLPDYRRCKLCREHITTSDREKLLEHLIKNHEGEIYIVEGA